MKIQKEWLNFLREQYPVGSRIKLRDMGSDDPCPIKPGSMGSLQYIDDIGVFHVAWDDGRGLGLIIGQDSFTVLPPPLQTLMLYMPLTADLYEPDDYGCMDEDGVTLYGRDLLGYESEILSALKRGRAPEEEERGIMRWYHKNDAVADKVRSVVFDLDEREGRLWGVAECKVQGKLTDAELCTLKEYVTGQVADGWGEHLEQQKIDIGGGAELYVHLWQIGKEWSIQTEQERFGPKLAEGLPEMCFSTLKSTGELICIKRGESGYYRSDWNTSDPARNEEIARDSNESLGVTDAQRKAMEAGSMFGWNCTGADPKTYEQAADQPQMGGMGLAYSL